MGVELDSSRFSKDRVTAWLGTSVQEHNLYGSTFYAKKSWLSGLSTGSRPKDCHLNTDRTNNSVSSLDDSDSQVESLNENAWTSTQSSKSTTESSATELTDYSESDDEKTTHRSFYVQQITSNPVASCTSGLTSTTTNLEVVTDDQWLNQYESKVCNQLPTPQSCSTTRPTGDDANDNNFGGVNKRRSAQQYRTVLPPCKLKRDTESTDHFVTLLIIFATRLVTAIWPLSASPPMMSSCFNGAGVLPLRVFIQETLRRSKTSYSTLQVALYYLVLLKDKLPQCDFTREQTRSSGCPFSGDNPVLPPPCRAMQCGRRMFLSALMLASKYLQDRNYSTRAWSKISGLRTCEINENEREYLKAVDFNLHLPKAGFDNWSKIVLALSKLSRQSPQMEYSFQDSELRNSAIGLEQMLSDVAPNVGLDDPRHTRFTESWWNDLLRKLNPDLIADEIRTDDFLRPFTVSGTEDRQSCAESSILTPPTSPESIASTNFHDALRPRGEGDSTAAVTLLQSSSRAQSPVRAATVPAQPRLPNLPTPVSTPQAFKYCALPKQASLQQHRSTASLSALRALQKPPSVNANLDRCPPPRPQACIPLSTRCPFQPAVLELDKLSQHDSAGSPSPITVASARTDRTSRSRSSSFNSTASGCFQQTFQSTLPTTTASLTPAREPRASAPCVAPTSSPSYSRHSSEYLFARPYVVPPANIQKTPSAVPFNDEGYGSGEELLTELVMKAMEPNADLGAAHALITLAIRHKSSLMPEDMAGYCQPVAQPAKGHKRTHSRVENDKMQDQVRRLLAAENSYDGIVMPELTNSLEGLPQNRCIQTPTKCWAESKLPVPNMHDSKRVAMHCPASRIAAHFLRSKLLKGTVMAS